MRVLNVTAIVRQSLALAAYGLLAVLPYSYALTRLLLRVGGAKIEAGVKIKSGCVFEPPGNLPKLKIGAGTFVNTGCRFASRGGISIGTNCAIGPGVFFETVNHYHSDGGRLATQAKRITVGDSVWIGAGCIILPGVTLGHSSIIAAGAVVTKDVHSNSVMGGVPAREIKKKHRDS